MSPGVNRERRSCGKISRKMCGNLCEIFSLLAAIFFLFWGVCTPEWRVKRETLIETYEGLWRRCYSGNCVDLDLLNTSGWFKNVQSIMIVAVSAASMSLGFFISRKCHSENRSVVIIYIILQYICGVLCTAGPVLYAIETVDAVDMVSHRYGYSFIITVVAAVTFFISGAVSTTVFCCATKRNRNEHLEDNLRHVYAQHMPHTSLTSPLLKADPLPFDLLKNTVIIPPDVIPEKNVTPSFV